MLRQVLIESRLRAVAADAGAGARRSSSQRRRAAAARRRRRPPHPPLRPATGGSRARSATRRRVTARRSARAEPPALRRRGRHVVLRQRGVGRRARERARPRRRDLARVRPRRGGAARHDRRRYGRGLSASAAGSCSALPQPGPVSTASSTRAGARRDDRHGPGGARQRARVFDARTGPAALRAAAARRPGRRVQPGRLAARDREPQRDDRRSGTPRTGRPRVLDDGGQERQGHRLQPRRDAARGRGRRRGARASGRSPTARASTSSRATRAPSSPSPGAPTAGCWPTRAATSRHVSTRSTALVEGGRCSRRCPGTRAGRARSRSIRPARARDRRADGGVRLWDARPEQALVLLGFHRGAVATASYSPDGRLVVSAGADRTARIWDVAHAEAAARAAHAGRRSATRASARTASSSSRRATTAPHGSGASRDGPARCTRSARRAARLARFSPDGTLVAPAAGDGTVALWRVARRATAPRAARRRPGDGRSRSRPTAGSLATARGGATLWSVADGRLLLALRGRRRRQPHRVLARRPPARDRRASAGRRGSGTSRAAASLHVLRGHRPAPGSPTSSSRPTARCCSRRAPTTTAASGRCPAARRAAAARPVRRADHGRLQPRRPLDRHRRADRRRALADRDGPPLFYLRGHEAPAHGHRVLARRQAGAHRERRRQRADLRLRRSAATSRASSVSPRRGSSGRGSG